MADISTLQIELEAGGVTRGIDAIERNLADLSGAVSRAEGSIASMHGGFGKAMGGLKVAAGAAAAAFAALGLGKVAAGIVEVNREFGKLQASLVTVTGSTEKAEAAFAALQEFAAKTPYSLQEVTGAFIKLRSYGLQTSEESLESFGNTASAMGKSLDQMVEAVADATTGEFERLKEFGIRSKKVGDEIIFTFQGVETRIKNNSQAIQGYIEDIGRTKFGGAMGRQAKEIDGALSNLGDTVQGLAYSFGEGGFSDAFVDFVRTLEGGLSSLKPFTTELGRMAGESLTSLTEGLKSAAASVKEFLGETSKIGTITATNGEIARATFDVIKEKAKAAFGNMVGYAEQWSKAFGEIGEKVFGFFESNWGAIGDYVKFGVVAWTEYIYTFFSVIGTFLQRLPRLFVVTFESAGAAISEFAKAAKDSLLNGNLDAFDGFAERVNKGFTDQWGGLFEDIVTEVKAGAGVVGEAFNQIGTEGGVQMRGRLMDMADGVVTEIADAIVENREQMVNAAVEVGKATGDALKNEISKASEDPFEKAGISAETFKTKLDGLISSYAPALARQREYNDAMQVLELAASLGAEELKKFGLTAEDVAEMMGNAKRALGEAASFFGQTMDGLRREAEALARGTDITSVAMGEYNDIVRQAAAANEALTDAQKAQLQQQLEINEQLRRERDMRDSMTGRLRDIDEEIRLLGKVGKERERAIRLMEVEREAIEKGLNPDKYVRQMSESLDRLEAEKERFNTFGMGMREALTEYAEGAEDIAGRTADAVSSIMSSMEDTLAKQLQEGTFRLKDFLKIISYELNRFAAQQIMGSFASLLNGVMSGVSQMGGGGGLLSSIFGGFRAEGGPVEAGKAYVVGERQPELFVPHTSGTIIPSVPTGGGAMNVTMEVRIDRVEGVSGTSEEVQRQMVAGIFTKLQAMLVDQQGYGGALAVRR